MVERKALCRSRRNLAAFALAATTGLCGFLAPAAQAEQGDSYLCEVEVSGKFAGTIPEMVSFIVGSGDSGTLVYDPFIANYYKEPIEAKLLVDNDARVAIRWKIKAVPEGTVASVTLQYELTYLKSEKTARLRAKLAYGESHEPSYPATCKRQKWK